MPPADLQRTARRVEVGTRQIEARLLPSTYDDSNRTVEIVAGTGVGVLRRDMDGPYVEVLGLQDGEVRMGRLQSGRAPLLDSHEQGRWDGVRSGCVLGLIEEAGIRESASPDAPDGLEIWVRVRLTERPDMEGVRIQVREGTLTNASLGYRVFEALEQRASEDGSARVFRATDWEPFEVSLVSVGADAYAGTRQIPEREPNTCTFRYLSRTDRAMDPEDEPTPDTNTQPADAGSRSASGTQTTPAPPQPTAPAPDDAGARAAREEGARAERERARGIRAAMEQARQAGLESEAAGEIERSLLEDVNATPATARERVLDALAGREEQDPVRGNHTAVTRRGEDERDKFRAAAENALTHRCVPSVELTENGRELRGMSLLRLAEEGLLRAGVNTRGMSRMQIARAALSRGVGPGLHGTSDFPSLVANVASKSLQMAYEAQPRTFLPFTDRNDLSDFKPTSVVQLGGSPSLQKLDPQGEIKRGTVGEKAESWYLSTYGIRVGFTRQMVVNDDLSALRRIPAGFGAAAAAQENDIVWALLTGNVVLAEDSKAIFHADHGNLSGGALAVAGLEAMNELARKQKGIAGRYINVELRHLMVPETLEVAAQQLVAQITPSTVGEVNPFRGRWDSITVEPRLGADSATAYYAAANPSQIDTLQYGYLQGEGEGPRVEEMDSWEIDGMEFRCLHDFGAGAIDFRGLYKSTGV